jgi:hypothetical protein
MLISSKVWVLKLQNLHIPPPFLRYLVTKNCITTLILQKVSLHILRNISMPDVRILGHIAAI